MSEREFLIEVEELYIRIEEWLEENAQDIDFETQQGILHIYLPTQKEMVISRQLPLREVWLAYPDGAFHFHKDDDRWITNKGEELFFIIQQALGNSHG